MNRNKEGLKINKKAIIPTVITLFIYLFSYYFPKIVIDVNKAHFITVAIDDLIPLYTPAVTVYILAYIQWAYGTIVAMKQETNIGYRLASATIIGSIVCFIIFMVYPNGIIRHELQINNIFDYLMAIIRSSDNILNAFPSMHCFCSTMVVIALCYSKDIKKGTIIFNIIFSIMVCASTVLTKQHFFVDVPSGILLACISMAVAKKYNFNKLFDFLNNKFLKL